MNSVRVLPSTAAASSISAASVASMRRLMLPFEVSAATCAGIGLGESAFVMSKIWRLVYLRCQYRRQEPSGASPSPPLGGVEPKRE